MAAKGEEVRAPYMGMPFRDRSWKGNQASFGAYFLRDLYQKGLLDEAIVRELVEQERLDVPLDQVMEAIRDPQGNAIPRGLVRYVEDVAELVVAHN